ncbi:MAG: hypothetical protein QOJ15_10295 [Bradyrhizobium sp.]|jgi:hypothetical protein|nr:hypothetical protein [Bradyrhizobium sp.]
MAPKHHPTPLTGGDREALSKELVKSRAMIGILAERSEEKRRYGEVLIREADNLACQRWNEKMWSDGGPAQPSPTIGQAINGGFPWLEVKCSRCRTPSSVDLAAVSRPPDTPVHLLEGRLDCTKCKQSKWKGRGILEGARVDENEAAEFADFDKAVAAIEHRHDFVVIDTPPRDSYLMRLAHSVMDTLVTPLNDSFLDPDVLANIVGPPCVRPGTGLPLPSAILARRPALSLSGMILETR